MVRFYRLEVVSLTEDIGICKLDSGGNIIKLEKGYYRQGMIFKSWDAYKNRPEAPCYVPELSDSVYTAKDFLVLCQGQKEFADRLFANVDWQAPETELDELLLSDEWRKCPKCNSLVSYNSGDGDGRCSRCGMEVSKEESLG